MGVPQAKAAAQKTSVKTDQGAMESFKRVLASDIVKHLIAGGAAGAVSRTIVSPLERMKILFQVRVVFFSLHDLNTGVYIIETSKIFSFFLKLQLRSKDQSLPTIKE